MTRKDQRYKASESVQHMTRDEDRKAVCAGKSKLSYSRAARVARSQNRRGDKAQVYKCPMCRHWHVGTPT